MLAQHTGTYSPILYISFTFPKIGLPQQLWTKYNGKIIVPVDSDERHY